MWFRAARELLWRFYRGCITCSLYSKAAYFESTSPSDQVCKLFLWIIHTFIARETLLQVQQLLGIYYRYILENQVLHHLCTVLFVSWGAGFSNSNDTVLIQSPI